MATAHYSGLLKQQVGCEVQEFDSKDVKTLLGTMKSKYGEEVYKVAKSSLILVNGINAGNINGFKTKLTKEDMVKFLPICGGG